MSMRQAVVIGAAPCGGLDFLKEYSAEETLYFCADGGLQTALKAGIQPHWYAGDNDSGGEPPMGAESWILPSEKDLTDLEMALRQALRIKPDRILLCSCTGGRQDHHLANLYLLEWLAGQGMEGIILDGQNEIRFLLPGEYRFSNDPDYPYFSVLPADRWIRGLTIGGAKYPLNDMDVPRGPTLTISNQPLVGEDIYLSFREGGAFFIRSRNGISGT